MNFISIFVLALFMSCSSEINSQKTNVKFQDIYHHYFTITPENYVIIDSQEKMDQIYTAIGKHYEGNRSPPIPSVTEEEKFILFKPTLKNSNDVEINKVEVQNQTLYITVKPTQNFDVDKTSRIPPSILFKIYTKQNLKKVIVNTLN